MPEEAVMDGPTGKTCDRCGLGTRAHVTYTKGSITLDWCDHHARVHGPQLLALGYVRKIRIPVAH